MSTISATGKRLLYSSDDVRGPILGDHPNAGNSGIAEIPSDGSP
jgi:hypothetical protein